MSSVEADRGALPVPTGSDSDGEADAQVIAFIEALLANSTLLSIFGLMGLGVLARRRKWLSVKRADGIRWACFEYLLPAVLLRNIWIAPVDVGLSGIAFWSAVVSVLRFFFLLSLSRVVEPLDKYRRGWLLLMTQGEMLALLYPLLLSTPHLAGRALACCILWDLGGNMWLCQGVLFGIAEHFFEGAPRRPRQSLQVDADDVEAAVDADQAKKEQTTAGNVLRVAWSVATKPLLHYCFLAFMFNFLGIALPQVLDILLWVLSLPFKPGIYFVVGFYGAAHAISSSDLLEVLQVLLIRYSAAMLLSIAVNCVIVEPLFSQTITLALFSPVTSNVIHIVAEQGSGDEQLKLTVCTGFASTVISTALQLSLLAWFSP
eukprot:TRINITY_DN52817_c0_g1_i1.p1 TRINITY_DN52817_c0_g1~~TRINITY_DN52817_c0_g1_i1.p1  ORF type:complete len:374 (-),score=63.72 TRINITY_DN52817_c0_g1_i1:76-1197(-)